ncbi:MAG: hypothetical protein NTZ87_00675 [Candidatus Nomurabacteria bacterium]|nr:hypothetical protein [Candidatus Nomurabacteria bacterium]
MKIGDYNAIMDDHNIFNQVVYTPLSEALKLLDERRKDKILVGKVEKLLNGDIPEILRKKKCAILFRQVATPNHETKRFLDMAKEDGLHPVIFEYHEDKFTSNNEFKHSLGQLYIQRKCSKNGDYNVEKITVVDFAKFDGKKLREVETLWKEPLNDFHKKLFNAHEYNMGGDNFYDASLWLKKNGGKAVCYYTNFFLLCSCFGVLFENFLTSKNSEGDFTKGVVLPSVENVINMVGVKPLIVPLEPMDIETDELWTSYHPKVKTLIPQK